MLLATQPEKLEDKKIQHFLNTPKMALDIQNINLYINTATTAENEKIKSYDEHSILEILTYQDENKLNSTQVAKLFNISRITLRKWKKHFQLIEN
jgi:DNA-binding transcriptional regulator YiaG